MAVFSADVAGYSRLLEEDEAATVKALTYKDPSFVDRRIELLRKAGLKGPLHPRGQGGTDE